MSEAGRPALLIYCPAASGGIAEHAHYQARALHEIGVDVEVLASREYLHGRVVPYPVARRLPTAPAGTRGLARRLQHAAWLCACPWLLATHVWQRRPSSVLLASYSEYLSPFWIWPHLVIRRVLRVRYGANLHDPVRDFQLGPKWWHALSVALAFKSLDFVILHQALPGPGVVPEGVAVHEAPVGVYDLAEPSSLDSPIPMPGVPEGVPVLVCFGHIRDNKNIDLLIRALPEFADLHLVVAGPPPSTGQRPVEDYATLARETSVAERVHISAGFVADGDLAMYFHRATWIAVTYASTFLSQSGVLSIAARARKQVLASSGPSPMQSAVERYGLGVFVEPDSLPAVIGGLRRLMDNPPKPDWAGYEAHASWATNARVIMAASGMSAGERQQA